MRSDKMGDASALSDCSQVIANGQLEERLIPSRAAGRVNRLKQRLEASEELIEAYESGADLAIIHHVEQHEERGGLVVQLGAATREYLLPLRR